MAYAFLVGRVIVGLYYLAGAWNHFAHLHALAAFAAARGVPAPQAAVLVAGLLLAVAGVTLLLGLYPRVGVAALVLFLVPVTFTMHAFWADADPVMRANDLVHFTKNLGLLGSSLMFLGVPLPWPYSVAAGARRTATAGVA